MAEEGNSNLPCSILAQHPAAMLLHTRLYWLPILAVQETLQATKQQHNLKAMPFSTRTIIPLEP